MNSETLTVAALGLFILGAIGGATLASFHWRNRLPPWALTVLHGLLVSSGILTLFVSVSDDPHFGLLHYIIGWFLLVGVGGAVVLSFHLRKRHPPRALIVGHAMGAATGVVTLLLFVLKVIGHN